MPPRLNEAQKLIKEDVYNCIVKNKETGVSFDEIVKAVDLWAQNPEVRGQEESIRMRRLVSDVIIYLEKRKLTRFEYPYEFFGTTLYYPFNYKSKTVTTSSTSNSSSVPLSPTY